MNAGPQSGRDEWPRATGRIEKVRTPSGGPSSTTRASPGSGPWRLGVGSISRQSQKARVPEGGWPISSPYVSQNFGWFRRGKSLDKAWNLVNRELGVR
jgi:hypothetical protein